MQYSWRDRVAALVDDLPRLIWSLRPSTQSNGMPRVFTRNRGERLVPGPGRTGVRCNWQWMTELHLTSVFPWLGLHFMRRSLADWPVGQQSELEATPADARVSFVIGHRGLQRLPHLLLVLRSIAGQRGVPVECIVVEQSVTSEVMEALPRWVRYPHMPVPPEQRIRELRKRQGGAESSMRPWRVR